MAPAVPFALLGVVQLASVAVWLGVAGAAWFPDLRRRTTVLVVAGALAMAVADAITALRLQSGSSEVLGAVRLAGLALIAVGAGLGALAPRATVALPAIVVPLGAKPSIAIVGGAVGAAAALAEWIRSRTTTTGRRVGEWLAAGFLMTAVATALADPARHSTNAALALLSARGAAALALGVALVLIARDNLLGKLLGSIVAGVVAMAIGAVAVVGTGVASEVQSDQSKRLEGVATVQQKALQSVETRAGIYARVVALCPTKKSSCVAGLKLLSVDPDYFALIATRHGGVRTIAQSGSRLDGAALLQIGGSDVISGALAAHASPQSTSSGELVLHGSPSRLAVIAAVPGRPGGSENAQIPPSYAAAYGVGLTNKYLTGLAGQIGYDVSIIAGHHVVASNLGPGAQRQVLATATATDVNAADPTTNSVVPAQGDSPTVAFVPIHSPDNDDVRIATMAISQPASAALAAQHSVLRRLVLTALVVLLVVAIGAVLMAQRIVDPVSRLTVAARRVSAGDLDTLVLVGGSDEIGSLSRAFAAMTTSLRSLTGDLRDAAVAEAALRGRLESVVGSMTDGLVTTDADGLVAGANPMAVQLLGVAEDDIVGLPIAEVLAVRTDDGEAVMSRLRDGGATDAVLHRADGTQLPVRVSTAPLIDEPGQLVVLSDRTRDREIERMKTEFLSNVSHELRTPLTPIRGYAELLARKPDLPKDKVQEFVAEILAGTTRMNRAVELLVDVAALEAGRVSLQRRTVTVRSFADERIEQWRNRYPERTGDLRRRIASKLPSIDVDPVWLSKALDELVDNAVKYSRRGTPIVLTAALATGGDVRLSIRDSGPGIEVERLGELLGDFSQADGSETRHVGGFGLGLGFVSRVAQQLGLQLEVASSPGKGAEFAVHVPAAAAGMTAKPGRSKTRR